ncbi:FAD-dependent oxidoreductase [Candidatus Pacearchaeota archaeon]|nr:FAD-dependent oxidoreductase [Candidatus Pacearchaeota archaeon]
MKKTAVILGAGITGLTLGWKLSKDYKVIIIERGKDIGGTCSSFCYKGFTLDYGPHKLYPQKKEIEQEIKSLYEKDPQKLLEIKKESTIFLKENFFKYPLQIKEILTKFNIFLGLKLMSNYGLNMVKQATSSKKKEESYDDFLISKFGKSMYELVFKENAEKIWGNPKDLSSDLAKTRVASPNLIKVILDSITNKKDPSLNAETFFYPQESIRDLSERISQKIKKNNGEIILESKLEAVKVKGKRITHLIVNSGRRKIEIKPDVFISTANLKDVLPFFDLPNRVLESLNKLKFRGLALAYILVNKEKAMNSNWAFFPEKRFIFQRLSEQKSFSAFNQPKDKTAIIAEISIRPEIEFMEDAEIIEKVKADLIKLDILKEENFVEGLVLRKKEVYPIYSLDYKEQLKIILDWADENLLNFVTCGRNGLFNYNNMDHCMDMATKIAEHLKTNGTIEEMRKLRKYFESYKIVD